MANRPVIEYYFSFVSLWSYVGSRRFEQLVKKSNAEIIYKPIDLMDTFSISGGLPVKERSKQRQAYRLLEMERWRQIRNISIIDHPKFYPTNPSLAHRVFLAAISELGHSHPSIQDFAHKGLETVWANEGDIADPETIVKVADSCGLEGKRLLERAQGERELGLEEERSNGEAREKGVFGAPWYVYRGEPFWGQDRLEMLEGVIQEGREALPLPVVE